MDIVRETEKAKDRKYITAYVSEDGTVSPMGNSKGWVYAKDVCDRHNTANPGRWKIFEIKEVYPETK